MILHELNELENYCNLFLNPNSNEDVSRAELIINEFKSKASIDDCYFVLNYSNNSLLFHEVFVSIYDNLVTSFVVDETSVDLSITLWNWIIKNYERLNTGLQNSVLLIYVKIVKKLHANNLIQPFNDYMDNISGYISKDDINYKLFALDMINSLLSVYDSYTVDYFRLKISIDDEKRLHNIVQNQLPYIFNQIIQLCKIEDFYQGDLKPLKNILTGIESIFKWDFKLLQYQENINSRNRCVTSFDPGSFCVDIISDLEVIPILWEVHWRIRHHSSDIGCLSLICMQLFARSQLSFKTVSSTLLSPQRPTVSFTRTEFIMKFLECFIRTFTTSRNIDQTSTMKLSKGSSDFLRYELPLIDDILDSISHQIFKINFTDDSKLFDTSDKKCHTYDYVDYIGGKINEFIEFYCEFSVKCIELSTKEDYHSDTLLNDTVESILPRVASLNSIMTNKVKFDAMFGQMFERLIPQVDNCFNRLFHCFTLAHLAHPDGYRSINSDESDLTDMHDENNDLQYSTDDKILYEGSLYATGIFSRKCLTESINYLTGHLHKRLLQFNQNESMNQETSISNLEDIHWLICILGYSLLNITEDRTLFIDEFGFSKNVQQIFQHSANQLANHFSIQPIQSNSTEYSQLIGQYQQLMIDLCNDIEQSFTNFQYNFTIDLSRCDDLIRMFYLCIRGYVIVVKHCESGQVVSDFVWFLKRMMLIYLQKFIPTDDLPVCPLRDMNFVGQLSQYYREHTINMCMKLVKFTMDKWNHDPTVVNELLSLLKNIGGIKSIAEILVKSPLWLDQFVRPVVAFHPDLCQKLTTKSLVRLIKYIIDVSLSIADNELTILSHQQVTEVCSIQQQYLQIIFDSLKEKMQIFLEIFNRKKDVPENQISLLLCFIHGIVRTKWTKTMNVKSLTVNICQIFDLVFPYIKSFVDIITKCFLYHPAIVTGLLVFLKDLLKWCNQPISQAQKIQIFELYLSIVYSYTQKLSNKHYINANNYTQDEILLELKLIYAVVEQLLTQKAADNLETTHPASIDNNISGNNTNDIALYETVALLIQRFAPFTSPDLLNIPDFGNSFTYCCTEVAQFCPASFLKMDAAFVNSLLQLLVASFSHLDYNFQANSFQAVHSLCVCYFSNTAQQTPELQSVFLSLVDSVFNWLKFDLITIVSVQNCWILVKTICETPVLSNQLWMQIENWLISLSNMSNNKMANNNMAPLFKLRDIYQLIQQKLNSETGSATLGLGQQYSAMINTINQFGKY